MGFKFNMISFVTMMVAVAITLGALPAAAADAAAQARFEASKKQLEATITSARAAGKSAVIISAQEQLVQLTSNFLGPEHPETVTAILNLGRMYYRFEQRDRALGLQQRALTIREKTLGVDHPESALARMDLALTYYGLKRYSEALPLLQRTLTIFEKTLGTEHPTTVEVLGIVATTYGLLEKHDQALLLHQRALAFIEKERGPIHKETIAAINNLAANYSALAQHDQALLLRQRALINQEKISGSMHPETVIALNNLAAAYEALIQYNQALPLRKRVLAIREKIPGHSHPETARAINNLAWTHVMLNQFDQALPLQRRALTIAEQIYGTMHPNTAIAIGNLAASYDGLAHYDQAIILGQHALAVTEKTLGPEHLETARALNNLAWTYANIAQYGQALFLRQRALAITEKVRGPSHPDTAKALLHLAATYASLWQPERALLLQKRALAIVEKTLGSTHPDSAWILNDLAVTFLNLAQPKQALLLQQRALAIAEKSFGQTSSNTARALHNSATMLVTLERYEQALPQQLHALMIFEKLTETAHPDKARVLFSLGRSYRALGRPDLAIAVQKQAVNILQNTRQTVSRIDAETLKSYTESIESYFHELAALLTRAGRLPEAQLVIDMLKEHEQFEFIRRNSNADPRQRRIGLTAEEQQWMGRYRQIADRLFQLGQEEQALQNQARSGLTPEQNKRLQQIAADLKVAQAAFESFLKDLRKNFADSRSNRSAEFAETSVAALRELQGLLKGLGQDTALVQYFITENQLGMLITTGAVQRAHTVNKMDAKDLNRKIAEFRRQLNNPKSNPQPLAQELYQLLFAPIANDLEQAGIRNVMLSPDGVLRYVPFAALHDGQGFLMQRFNLPLYTSVARERLRAAVSPNWRAAGLGVTRRHGEFSPLPAVKAEMESIIKTGARGVLPGEVHLDEAFTANKLQDVAQRRFPVMHIASHFRFSPGTEINSFLLLGDGQRLTLGDLRTQNYRFDGVDLLTLSACETGLGGGRDARGREIEGFGVIAQQQGANAVLATLWPVADQSTALLMAEMYRLRQEKQLTKAEALRQAQQSLQKQARYAHPYYWAPFILMGNWK